LFNVLAVLSLLLCVGISALWIRGGWMYYSVWGIYHAKQAAAWPGIGPGGGIDSEPGRMSFWMSRKAGADKPNWLHFESTPARRFQDDWTQNVLEPRFRLMGFRYYTIDDSPTYKGASPTALGFNVDLPDWFLVAVTATAPALWLRRRLKKKPLPEFACRTCGYDLRATPWRCPECGTIPEKANETSK
jgi:hypothetical protein